MLKPGELEKIVEDLKNPRPYFRGKAVETLMLIRDETVIPALFKLIQKEIDFSKVQFCRLMGKMRSPRGVAPLVLLLLGESEKVAAEAAAALDQIQDDTKVEALMALLTCENHPAKIYAIRSLGIEKRVKAVPLLISALSDKDQEIRILVIDALRQIADTSTAYPLAKLLQDSDQEIVYEAIYALGEIGNKLTGPKITPFFSHEEADIRRAAVWAVGKLDYAPAISKLIQMLKDDPDDEVREEICRRLGKFGGKRVLGPLANARLEDKAHNVRVYADWALKEILKETNDDSVAREIHSILGDAMKKKHKGAS